ncbi:inositol polyphosphate 5-phosphatase K isoform X1 [Leptinotarsa decemlineata]|uniref:inositol polyphosphate 5-phosphatase K isoform X1 n=1 Tax=Leptinotarsa decemlineata TaxID=7539 RepID=UPI003D30625C
MDNLRLYISTYNVGTSNPDQELKELFALSDQKNEKGPDFFILGFQEVKAQPHNMVMDSLFDDPWTLASKELLQRDYIKLKSVRLQGLLLLVFSLRKHLLNIRDMESEYTRTGLAGMWGNKGAVTIRLSIYGCSICFVNAHLSAHDNQLKDRVEDYNSIIQEQEFHVAETSKIFYHDYVFWMGDLNFRLQEEFDKTPEEIERLIIKKELKKLFEHDQLRAVMKKGEAFSELTEQDPDFPPTFKFEVGAPCYDHKRRPAWCDRILYCVNRHNYENVTLKVEQLSYKSHPSYTLSDHRPVTAEFMIKIPQQVQKIMKEASLPLSVDQVFSDYSECVIEFDEIGRWDADIDNYVYYTVTKDVPETTDDWIGLFKDNFDALDDYITYEYVNKCTTPIEASGKSTDAHGDLSKPTRFKVIFPEVPNHVRGVFCLVYFSQTEDKVSSVLGMSNPFLIK